MTDGSALPAPTLRLKVSGMDCGSCALTIESALARLDGVRRAQVDFTTETLEVEGRTTPEAVAAAVARLGYRIAEASSAAVAAPAGQSSPGTLRRLWSQDTLRLAIGAAAIAAAIVLLASLAPGALPAWLVPVALAAAVVVATAPIAVKGLRALVFGRRVTIDLLMTIAAVGALAIGEYWEALAVVVLFTFGEALESLSAERARASLRGLLALQPDNATVLRQHAGGHDDRDHGGGHGHDHDRAPLQRAAADAAHRHDTGECCGHDHDHAHDHGRDDHHDHDHGHAHDHRSGREHDADHGHDHGHGRDARHEHDHRHDHSHDHGQGRGHDHDHDHGSAPAEPRHQACGDGAAHVHAEVIPAAQVQPGDRVLVRPGERVPVDGRIAEGESMLNESAVTGESVPVRRIAGEEVMAGTVNGEGALEIVASRVASDSTIARIARLVEQAQAQRSPQERFVDRFARLYTPAVVALAVLVVAIPVLLFGQPLLDSPDGSRGWLYRGLALLIVACPCALVISIPVTVVSALTRLAGLGVLVKGGAALDRLADVRVVAFDKTGTLTEGRPAVTAVQGRDCRHEDEVAADCDQCTDVIALAASVELRSGHPIAHAIAAAANARGVTHRYPGASGIRAIAGRGVVGEVGGARVAVGSDALFTEATPPTQVPDGFARALRDSHRTVMLVARDAAIVGAIGVEDTVRDASAPALRELSALSPPVATLMLTGDNRRVAQAVAAQLGGIDDVRAGLGPGQKLDAIDEARLRHGAVAMVGDGINDGPALARADVGLAMGGSGSAQAMETADIVLMQDDLHRVPAALRLARLTRRVVRQNVALSLGLKLAFLGLAIPGWATLWLAVAADVGATLLVTVNGMRLLRANG